MTEPTTLTVRTHRRLDVLVERLEPGSLAVIDHRDLDAATARALADRAPYAVLNAAEFVSGRYANLGPRVLADAGVLLLEGERDGVRSLRDGAALRYADGRLYDGDKAVLEVHELTGTELDERLEAGRSGLATQLESFAHTAGALLREEEDVLLHGLDLPQLRAQARDRPVVVVADTATAADLAPIRRFLRQQRPVLVGVGAGADLLGRRRADVVVTGPDTPVGDRALRRAREVVVPGAEPLPKRIERLDVPVHRLETSLPDRDLGLLLAHAAGARVVLPVGAPADLDQLIDRDRSDQASMFLTRLRLGATWVEPASVPLLYTGRVRLWQVLAVLLLAVAVLGVTIAATPIGQEWWQDLLEWAREVRG